MSQKNLAKGEYDGYWNIKSDPSDPGCYKVRDGCVFFVDEDGKSHKSMDFETFREQFQKGEYAPSKWLPPYNPADTAHTLEVTHAPDVATCDWELGMFLTNAALDVLIALHDATQKAPESVRKHFARPSACDLAIAHHVHKMLTTSLI